MTSRSTSTSQANQKQIDREDRRRRILVLLLFLLLSFVCLVCSSQIALFFVDRFQISDTMRSAQQADYAPQISLALAPIDRDRIVAEIVGDEAALTAPIQTPLAGGIVIAQLPNSTPVILPTPTTLIITPTPVFTVTLTTPTLEATEPAPSPTSPPPPDTVTPVPPDTVTPVPPDTVTPVPPDTVTPVPPDDTPTPVPPPDDDDDNLSPVVVADTALAVEDGPAVIIPVLANDTDPDGSIDITTLVIISGPANGVAVVNPATGAITYTPNPNFNGTDTFTYQVCDNDNSCATATVTITVTPVNDPPIAVDDAATTTEETPVAIAVLLNDSDPDGDPLNIISITAPANGMFILNPDNSITYTPNPNFTGIDTFTYEISDGIATDVATVTVTVGSLNDPPVAVDDTDNTAEDTSQLVAVLDNDIDIDGPNPLTVIAVSQPANGTVTIEPPRVRYTPNLNFDGTDVFTYTISDGLLTDSATVTITIIPINDPPVAVDDGYSTSVNTPLVIFIPPGILGNDFDIELGSTLIVITATIVPPTNGALIPNSDGTFTYTPNFNFTGVDTFSYQITDGAVTSNFATVTITIP